MGYTSSVREFSRACNGELPRTPRKITSEDIVFIRQMVHDELDELARAQTVTEQSDALIDAIYYIFDFAARHGINLDPLFEIVHRANMQKVVDGKVLKREDGKVLKPVGWEDPGPKLEQEMVRQSREGGFQE